MGKGQCSVVIFRTVSCLIDAKNNLAFRLFTVFSSSTGKMGACVTTNKETATVQVKPKDDKQGDVTDYSPILLHRLGAVEKLLEHFNNEYKRKAMMESFKPSYVTDIQLIRIVAYWFEMLMENHDHYSSVIDTISKNIIDRYYQEQAGILGHSQQKQYEAAKLFEDKKLEYDTEFGRVLNGLYQEIVDIKSHYDKTNEYDPDTLDNEYWVCKEHGNHDISKLCVRANWSGWVNNGERSTSLELTCYHSGSVHHFSLLSVLQPFRSRIFGDDERIVVRVCRTCVRDHFGWNGVASKKRKKYVLHKEDVGHGMFHTFCRSECKDDGEDSMLCAKCNHGEDFHRMTEIVKFYPDQYDGSPISMIFQDNLDRYSRPDYFCYGIRWDDTAEIYNEVDGLYLEKGYNARYMI